MGQGVFKGPIRYSLFPILEDVGELVPKIKVETKIRKHPYKRIIPADRDVCKWSSGAMLRPENDFLFNSPR